MTSAAAPKAYPFNAVNRGVYIADNLEFLRTINDECVDLVCIDPPFAKNETFTAEKLKPPLSPQETDNEKRLLAEWGIRNAQDAAQVEIAWPYGGKTRGGYKDIWSWEKDVHYNWIESIEDHFPAVNKLIDATRYVHSESTAAYLCYMAIRLIEIYRVLKPTGSLYLHCDHTANGYLRQLMDGIFGHGENGSPGFRNEIAWCYTGPSNTQRWFPRKHDTIFWYSKSEQWTFNRDDVRIPYKQLNTQHAKGSAKTTGIGGRLNEDNVDDFRGRGKVPESWWTDFSPVGRLATERTGYPTQKPYALAERIIKAVTNPGDVVLDCFAGCAYSAIAAERLGRQWTACDLNPRAWTVFKRQFVKTFLLNPPLDCDDVTTGQQVLPSDRKATVHGPRQLPILQSRVSDTRPKDLILKERKFKVPASIIPEAEMLEELLKLSGYQAWCCGFANRRPDGSIIEASWNFHLDHIAPKSRENTGTSNDIQNRAPMCPYHNIRKNNRRVGLAEYRQEIADRGEMVVKSVNDLINLDYALAQANIIFARAYARRNPAG